jgi:hypothetical protein
MIVPAVFSACLRQSKIQAFHVTACMHIVRVLADQHGKIKAKYPILLLRDQKRPINVDIQIKTSRVG